jgi:hypothetical protein
MQDQTISIAGINSGLRINDTYVLSHNGLVAHGESLVKRKRTKDNGDEAVFVVSQFWCRWSQVLLASTASGWEALRAF